jgi:hypothetical protein
MELVDTRVSLLGEGERRTTRTDGQFVLYKSQFDGDTEETVENREKRHS